MHKLIEQVKHDDRVNKLETAPKPSFGYGGKFGVEKDRMDKSAVDWSHVEQTEKHASQKDYSTGFGGKYGVQKDRQDKSAVGWNDKTEVAPHSSQTDASHGFGGKFGVQTDRVDASAAGWLDSSNQDLAKHPSQEKRLLPQSTGSLANLRNKFEQGSLAAKSQGPTADQLRVQQEQSTWAAQRQARASREPVAPAEPATTELPCPVVGHPQPVNQSSPTLSGPQEPVQSDEPDASADEFQHQDQVEQVQQDMQQPGSLGLSQETVYTVIADYDYVADAQDELTFKAGDVIRDVRKVDEGWWLGCFNGQYGIFPANYVTEQP